MTEHFCIEFRFFIEGEGIGPACRVYAYASCLAMPAPSCRGMPSAWIMGRRIISSPSLLLSLPHTSRSDVRTFWRPSISPKKPCTAAHGFYYRLSSDSMVEKYYKLFCRFAGEKETICYVHKEPHLPR